MEMRTSQPELPDKEEEGIRRSRVKKTDWLEQSMAWVFWLLWILASFITEVSSMMQALKLKQMVEEGLVQYRNIFGKNEKQKSQRSWCVSIKLHHVCLSCLPSMPFTSAALETETNSSFFLLLSNLLNTRRILWKLFSDLTSILTKESLSCLMYKTHLMRMRSECLHVKI